MLRRLRALAPFLVALGLMIPLAYAADTITTNILITKQKAGGNLNTWGDIANANFQSIDNKFGSTTVITTTGGTTTLTSTQEIVQVVRVTGALVSNATLQFSCRGGYWAISNETSGAFTVTANCSGQTGSAIAQGGKLGVYSDGTDIRAVGAAGTKVVGEVFDYAGSTCPAQSINPYGQAISRTTYATLFAITSTTYGTGDGFTTFNVPDLRGRVVAGQDNMGGVAANRLTNAATGGVVGATLGATGGQEAHTMTSGELVAHTHTQQGSFTSGGESADHTHTQVGTFTSGNQGTGHTHTGTTTSNGDHSHTATVPTNTTNFTATGGSSTYTSTGTINTGTSGAHTHTMTTGTESANHSHLVTISGQTGSDSVSHTHSTTISGATASTGSSTAFNEVQPTIILNKCIYTGV